MPLWLSTTRTALLPKNSETNRPENYRPIALQNSMYKIYTSILNYFLEDHCRVNNILGIEQAAAKKGSWGCTDQLLINKAIMEEVKSKRRNLVCVWLDYKKAFDSVPHDWLIKALHLAKVQQKHGQLRQAYKQRIPPLKQIVLTTREGFCRVMDSVSSCLH